MEQDKISRIDARVPRRKDLIVSRDMNPWDEKLHGRLHVLQQAIFKSGALQESLVLMNITNETGIFSFESVPFSRKSNLKNREEDLKVFSHRFTKYAIREVNKISFILGDFLERWIKGGYDGSWESEL